ncbi:hypothetical protein O7614_26800 [Micromonospora sp. WMMD961]|uniref:hypothetical protein n=1 Tax=Micromonospora sp. WMMD961 TaxID=3016100 RepID=UPI002417854A|nr:hypothetical protein [Micromonospora sp. WMMD961]MDG4783274.1 hypothetical protein [Micromonospora sp. WMMD961]
MTDTVLPEVADLEDGLAPLFEAMGWSEDEIQAAQRRHPDAADRIYHSFILLQPQHDLLMRSELLYRAHCRELLNRVARNEDTRPGTAAECIAVLRDTSLVGPLNMAGTGLYFRLWRAAGLPPISGATDNMHYEALAGSAIDGAEAELRKKLRQADRSRQFSVQVSSALGSSNELAA